MRQFLEEKMPTVSKHGEEAHSPRTIGSNMRVVHQAFLTTEEFEKLLSEETDFDVLVKFFTDDFTWEDENLYDEESRLFEKTFGLITSTDQAAELWDCQNSCDTDRDERLLAKMLELATNHQDLDVIYLRLSREENEIRRRNFIRKLFDKADDLGYPDVAER